MPTLFVAPQITVDTFQTLYKRVISLEFTSCMDIQLTRLFELKTSLKINKQISISSMSDYRFFVETGKVSKIAFNIYVNHNWNPVTVLWKSKSGRIYKLEDTDIDCEDVEFWFEELDVALIHRQMFPNVKLPFKLKDLSYELIVTRINMDATIELQLKAEQLNDVQKIELEIDNFITGFNEKSEKKDRLHGVIHNWKTRMEGDKMIYDIDLGSTGPYFFKKLLPHLSELNYFTLVELC